MLFDTFASHPLQLANHMVMAPLTRSRATPEHTPNALMATCYGQRATAGLNLPGAKGYTDYPALADRSTKSPAHGQ